jgi:sulfur-carrier protein
MKQEQVIQVFGQLAEITGAARLVVPAADSLDNLKDYLVRAYPKLATISFAVAIDKKICIDNISLTPNTEIALLPPFSGG